MKINNLFRYGYGLAIAAGLTYTACQKLNHNKQEVQQNKQEYRYKTPEELQRIVPDKRVIDTATISRDTIYGIPLDYYVPNSRTIKYVKNDSGKVISQIVEVVTKLK